MLKLPKLNPLRPKRIPVHIAINTSRITPWMKEKEKNIEEAMEVQKKLLNLLVKWQERREIPVLSVRITTKSEEHQKTIMSWLASLLNNEDFVKAGTRVFVIGDWYGLYPGLVDSVKAVMEETSRHEKRFLNILLNYDGQEEIVRAVEVITRMINANKMKLEDVNKTTVKESLYSSNSPPPELIIETSRKYSGVLLWDSKNTLVHFSRKYWLDYEKADLDLALEFYAKDKKEEEKQAKEQGTISPP